MRDRKGLEQADNSTGPYDAPHLDAIVTGPGTGSQLCRFRSLILSDHQGIQA